MDELFTKNGVIISNEEWKLRVGQLRNSMSAVSSSLAEQKIVWMQAFENAIVARAKEAQGRIGVFFSGGVDSAIIALVLHKNNILFTCYTVGFQDEGTKDPEDIFEARKIAQYFEWQHKEWILSLQEFEPIFAETARVLGETANPISVGVGSVVVAAAQLAKKDGVTTFFGGLGSEEIFAGYKRHEKAHFRNQLDDECWSGLLHMYERDLVRDCKLVTSLKITVLTPFLDSRVIVLAMRFPVEERIKEDHKKYILRVMAEEYGLPTYAAFRPKRAAQYGSRTESALDKIARQNRIGQEEYVQGLRKKNAL